MELTSIVAGRKVAASGMTVLQRGTNSFTLKLADVVYDFVFEAGDEMAPRSIYEVVIPLHARITLYGWHNPLGTAAEWESIATVSGKTYSIALFVHGIGTFPDISRSVAYSIFEEA